MARSSWLRCFRLTGLLLAGTMSAQTGPARGPLRVLPGNPRYFTDGSGKAIYLAGSHIWQNFQDSGHRLTGSDDPPPVFDYDRYLNFLTARRHNFFRLWRWDVPKWTDRQPEGVVKYCRPHPWPRTGPGLAQDGKPKFDLEGFDPDYFDRLHRRVQAARDRGIYVSVMLFEGWEIQFTDAWKYHPFADPNNINGVEGDANGDGYGLEYNSLDQSPMGRRVLALQEAYVRKVIDTVNDLDNVLYEICNEAGAYSTEWQYHLIRYLTNSVFNNLRGIFCRVPNLCQEVRDPGLPAGGPFDVVLGDDSGGVSQDVGGLLDAAAHFQNLGRQRVPEPVVAGPSHARGPVDRP